MSDRLPINVLDLLRQNTVEGERIEYKAGWNPEPIIRTICAFANDFSNLGGGYIVIGQDCNENGQPVFPPAGIAANQLDKIQRELYQYCLLIKPQYFPLLSIHEVEGKTVVILSAPGGQNRPYQAPKDVTARTKVWHYYIRRYSSTVEARGGDELELLSLAANVPFDDRFANSASVTDLSRSLIQEFLKEVKSELAQESSELSIELLGRQMNIVGGATESPLPKNVGLLFFNDTPERFFPGVQIDVVWFPDGPGGDRFVEKTFKGPLSRMTREALDYIKRNYIEEIVIKQSQRAEARRVWNFPFAAVEEVLVNAVYHRSYEEREPIGVRITPTELVVLSFPGPDRSINLEELRAGRAVSRRYRNRRIGEFLKELDLTEGRATGIPKVLRVMSENGSALPTFETDQDRTSFVVRLPCHPQATAEVTTEVAMEVTMEVTTEVGALLRGMDGEMSRSELQKQLGLKNADHFRKAYIIPAIEADAIEMTIPDKPNSSRQRYRLTKKGKDWLNTHKGKRK